MTSKELEITNYIISSHMKAGEYIDIKNYDDVSQNFEIKELICSEIEVGGARGLSDGGGFLEEYDNDVDNNEIRLLFTILNTMIQDNDIDLRNAILNYIKFDIFTYQDFYGNSINYQFNYVPVKDFIHCLNKFDALDYAHKKIVSIKN
jgi:hypothetical protein